MKMSEKTYEMLKNDIHAVFEHNGKAVDSIGIDYEILTMGNMWTVLSTVHHNRYSDKGLIIDSIITEQGRSLPHTGQHIYDLIYKVEDLDDIHVETAFRKMIKEWKDA